MVIWATWTHIFSPSSSRSSYQHTHLSQAMVPHLAPICAGPGYYLRTHLLCLHCLMIFSTSTPVYKKNNQQGRSTFTNRTETPGNTPPSFWLEKKQLTSLPNFLCSSWDGSSAGTKGTQLQESQKMSLMSVTHWSILCLLMRSRRGQEHPCTLKNIQWKLSSIHWRKNQTEW